MADISRRIHHRSYTGRTQRDRKRMANAAAACKDQSREVRSCSFRATADGSTAAFEVTTGQTVTLLATGQSMALARSESRLRSRRRALVPHRRRSHRAMPVEHRQLHRGPLRHARARSPNLPANGLTPQEISCPTIRIAVHQEDFWSRSLVWSGNQTRVCEAFAHTITAASAKQNARAAPRINRFPSDGAAVAHRPHDMFREELEQTGRAHIACRCDNDVAILKYPLDVPLNDDTRMAWSWRIDRLPAGSRKIPLPHHDYLSVAVEFENGQDLTYYWSAGLPAEPPSVARSHGGTSYETHMVLRSGPKGLGQWIAEEQPVLPDYSKSDGRRGPEAHRRGMADRVSAFQRRKRRGGLSRHATEGIRAATLWIGP